MAHILIIEPDKLLAQTFGRVFEHAGYTVTVVYSGQEAIEAADACTPEVVLMELHLAAQDGVAFLHEFRSYAEWRAIPVIVQTVALPAVIEPVLSALQASLGVAAYLYKPATTLARLQRTVREVVEGSGSAAGGA